MESLPDTISSNSTEELPDQTLIAYKYITPTICVIGIIGNAINLVVLTSKELKQSTKGHQRSKSMFTYMKVLAITDIFSLVMNIQSSAFTVKGYFRTTDFVPMPTKGMAEYVWNYMWTFWHIFLNCSDYVVVMMTLVRFQIINNVDQFGKMIPGSDSKPHWFISAAILIPFMMHAPYFILYEVIPCGAGESHVFLDCWNVTQRIITKSSTWELYGYIYQLITKWIPTLIICILNLIMLFKMKKIMKKRNEFRKGRRPTVFTGSNLPSIHEEDNDGRPSGLLNVPTSLSNQDLQVSGDANSNSVSNATSRASLEKKESERQFKLNGILLTLAFFHFLSTLLGNISYLIQTVYRDAWLQFNGKATFVTVGNVLLSMNYAKNFYLYCLVHEDIRTIAISKLRQLKFWT